MSIRWRILGSFFLVILITVLISTGLDYFSKSEELSKFSTNIRTEDFAKYLSRQYTQDKSWENVDDILVKLGADDLEDFEPARKRIPLVFILVDAEGNVIKDSFSALLEDEIDRQFEGESANIVDYDTDEVVGYLKIGINRDYLIAESRQFFISILKERLIQGTFAALIALVIGIWLSYRITSPVKKLTEAMQSVAESEVTLHLPLNSNDEIGQMSASFNQMIDSLQTQRELRKRLVDDVSHEINTPLSVIRLEAKGLKDELKQPADAADQIIDEVDKLSNLIYDLNFLAETDTDALRLNLESKSIAHVLVSEVERWALQSQAVDIVLDMIPLPPDLPDIRMDSIRISQVVANLIKNSLQFTPAGGKVTVRCVVDDRGVVVSVCDTGSGISPEELPYVFERMYKPDPSHQSRTGGQGLGLSIVKQIVEAHQGQVWAESELGMGSCFYFSLPV